MGIVCKCGNSKTYRENGRVYCFGCGRDKGAYAMTHDDEKKDEPGCLNCGIPHMGPCRKNPPDPIHETNNQINNNFYESIEEGVRKIVFLLRNTGINTECSCHHDGYIQCQTLDPTTDVMRIKAVMTECNISNFTIKIKYEGFHFGIMNIYSPFFVMKENENGYAHHREKLDGLRVISI